MWRIRPRLFLGDYRSGLDALAGGTAVDDLAALESAPAASHAPPGPSPAPPAPESGGGAGATLVLDTLRSVADELAGAAVDGDRVTLPATTFHPELATRQPNPDPGAAGSAQDPDAEVLSTLKSGPAANPAEPHRRPFAGVISLCELPLHPEDGEVAPVDPFTEWLQVPFDDGAPGVADLEGVVRAAHAFIERERQRGNVLVHCAAGMSRSVTVLAAWLCEQGDSPDEALASIAQAKGEALGVPADQRGELVAPAPEFRAFLERYRGR